MGKNLIVKALPLDQRKMIMKSLILSLVRQKVLNFQDSISYQNPYPFHDFRLRLTHQSGAPIPENLRKEVDSFIERIFLSYSEEI